MRTVVDALNALASDWLSLVASACWQSLLLALAVALVAVAWRRSSPAARYWLWQVVAIKLLVVPLWSWSLPLPWLREPVAASVTTGVAKADAAHEASAEMTRPTEKPTRPKMVPTTAMDLESRGVDLSDIAWPSWLLLGWGSIVALQFLQLSVQRRRLARLLAAARPADEKLLAAVSDVAASLCLKQSPRVRVTDADCSPFVCRALRPTLVLPAAVMGELKVEELRQVLAHELAHVKRRDLLWGWLPQVARMLYFFHPVAHWASYRIQLERELACDQLAMAISGRSAGEYAETLVRVVSSASRPDLLRAVIAAGLDGNRPPGARSSTSAGP